MGSSKALRELPLNEFCGSELLTDPLHKFYLSRSFITKIAKEVNDNDFDTGAIAMKYFSRPQVLKRIFTCGLNKSVEGIDPEKFETIDG